MTGISARKWADLKAARAVPRAHVVGGVHTWRAEEIRDWVTAGCPHVSAEDWKWSPTVRLRAETALRMATNELQLAREALAAINAAIEAGEKFISVKRPRQNS